MYTITYRERKIWDYKAFDKYYTINRNRFFIPKGTSLCYFYRDAWSFDVIAKEDICNIRRIRKF